ncbi:TIGR02678 family protein [Actinoplanes sp. NPDC051494]|uniref:TIGR02678 family protein n=1 Tax=Actinoplanes sp. NPDC051494 TaxID=3363907 RepID=UPI003792A156
MSTSAAVRDAQRAFTGLLERPLVTPSTDPELLRLVHRHLQAVSDTARRLGYRVQRVGRAVRLIRVPIDAAVTAPPRPHDAPARRVLSLVCCLAACCEEISGAVTLQRLSDMVRDLLAAPGLSVTGYDPDERAQRKALRDAAKVLDTWGVLRRRTSDDAMLDEWTERGSGPGAGYDVDRDALLLMTSPDILELALADVPDEPEHTGTTRTVLHLRALIETPAVLYADVPDADELRAGRGRRANDVARMTGGRLEVRTEGMVLVLTDDEHRATVADWPRARAADWVALLMADLAGQHGTRAADGTVALTSAQVDEVVEDLTAWRGDYLNKAQKTVPGTVRADAEAGLGELGLLRVAADGSWTLLSVAGRYRAPGVTITDTTRRHA